MDYTLKLKKKMETSSPQIDMKDNMNNGSVIDCYIPGHINVTNNLM